MLKRETFLIMAIAATVLLAACGDGPASPPVNQAGGNDVEIDNCLDADDRVCP
jgi:hypothetical protein